MDAVVLTEVRDNARWELRLEPSLAVLAGPNGASVSFTHAQIGADCGLATRDDTCTVTMPTPGALRTFRCSVTAIQPFMAWIRADLAPFERARIERELRYEMLLGLVWIVAGSPLVSHGYAYGLIGLGAALIALGLAGQWRAHRNLLLLDAALWIALAIQNGRVALGGSGVLAVVMTLFAASYAMRSIRLFSFHYALAHQK